MAGPEHLSDHVRRPEEHTLNLDDVSPHTKPTRTADDLEDADDGDDGVVRELKAKGLAKTMVRTEAQVQRTWSSKVVQHVTVFVGLTFIHALALLVFKLCAVDHSYPFSPASALVCTEVTKFCLATFLHRREIAAMPEETRPAGIVASFRQTATLKVWLATATVAVLYAVNNLLSFYLVAQTDPGTLAIAKATVPYLCAILLRVLGRPLTDIQWCCIILQCTGVAVTQYHKGGGAQDGGATGSGDANSTAADTGEDESTLRYSPVLYFTLFISIVVTAMSSVFNERIIKKFNAPLQQINMIMYLSGVLLASLCFLTIPRYADKDFFEGYSVMTILLIAVQAFYGLCVGYAYKYADVIIKNLSTSTTLALLVFISSAFFDVPLTFYSISGVVIIIVTSYLYLKREFTK